MKITRNVQMGILALGGISMLVVLSTIMGITIKQNKIIENYAHLSAKAYFESIIIMRHWNSGYGGVYVLKKDGVKSNPYLKNPDIKTADNRILTLKNPAVMTREISEIASKFGMYQYHITSLKLLNPNNAPDEWEKHALEKFEKGVKETANITKMNGKKVYRFMRPLLYDKSCVECHSHQGYKEGDVRGGISVILPYDKVENILKGNMQRMTGLAAIILIAMGVIFAVVLHMVRKLNSVVDMLGTEKNKLDDIVSSIDADLLLLDREMNILWVNKKLKERPMFKGDNSILGKQCYSAYCNFKHLPGNCPATKAFETKNTIRMEHPIHYPDGNIRYYYFTCSPVKDSSGKVTQVLELIQDITDKKKMENEIREKAIKLEEANIKLKELDLLKSVFIASMSHELRTPLNSIIGFTGIILQNMAGDINDEQRDMLNRVYDSSNHLLALISDVIDISKIEAGKIQAYIEVFELNKIIEEIALNLGPQISDKGLILKINIPKSIIMKTDKRRLVQCIINYLSNAIKFTERGKISIWADEIDGFVEIRVKDSGIGLKEEDILKLFKSFARIDSPLKIKTPGTGLGLYLTKKLAGEILGGSTSVESKYGEGSTFILKIPTEISYLKNKGSKNKGLSVFPPKK